MKSLWTYFVKQLSFKHYFNTKLRKKILNPFEPRLNSWLVINEAKIWTNRTYIVWEISKRKHSHRLLMQTVGRLYFVFHNVLEIRLIKLPICTFMICLLCSAQTQFSKTAVVYSESISIGRDWLRRVKDRILLSSKERKATWLQDWMKPASC